jgi:hypothetical protein
MKLTRRWLVLPLSFAGLFGIAYRATANPGDHPGNFVRGDTNDDGAMDISDAVFLLNYLFLGGAVPACQPAADINNDHRTDLSDAIYLLNHLFLGGNGPALPFPACGPDPGGLTCPGSRCNTPGS